MVEIVAGRLIAPYVGMSLYTWTAIIAVVLAGFSVGHWIGGLLAGPQINQRRGEERVGWALLASALTTLGAAPLLRGLAGPILGAADDAVTVILLMTMAVFFLPSLFVGIVSPILTKLAVDVAPDRAGSAIGRMYALGALGSIAGTLLAGYVFIALVGSIGTLLSVAALYGALAAIFFLRARRQGIFGLGVILIAALGATGGATGGSPSGAFQTVCQSESTTFCIRWADAQQITDRPSRLLALDHLVHGINDETDPGWIDSPYVQFVDAYLRQLIPAPEPVSAFFVGGGAYTLPRALAATRPGSELIVAEIDEAVTQAAVDHLWLAAQRPALDIRHLDGRWALQQEKASPRFDLIFGDAFHDIAVPAHLVTREFHQAVRARLKPGGFYALNVVDSSERPSFMLSLARTLLQDFAEVQIWRSKTELGAKGRVTYVVIAGESLDNRLFLESPRPPERVWLRLKPEALERRIKEAGALILTDDFAPVDRLLRHLILEAHIP